LEFSSDQEIKSGGMKYTLKQTAPLLETVMEIYKGISRQKAKQIIGHSEFTVNGKKITGNPKNVLPLGSTLEIYPRSVKAANRIPSRRDRFVIYYEDAYLIILLKPAGIISCGNQEMKVNNSFHKRVEAFISERDGKKIRLGIVHRLDREVEGLIMFAKSEGIRSDMKDHWPDISKMYLALTECKPRQTHGIFESWLKDTSIQKVVSYDKEVEGSKYAKTEYHWIRAVKQFHLLEIKLHTGRRNQIRVHLAELGCPVVGDRKYGADSTVIRQIRLAANKLEFTHPVHRKMISVSYQPPKRFFEPSETTEEKYKIF